MTPDLAPITRACALAWAHIGTKTLAGASPEAIRACIRHPEVRRLEQRLQDVSLTGDVRAVQKVLQGINRAYKTALQQVQRKEAA